MRDSVLITSALSALGMGIAYDQIKQATGMELSVLLVAGVIALIFGLCTGLYPNNKDTSKEEKRES